MIAIDTNVVVRFLTGDDKLQAKKAAALFKKQDVYIPDTVILETEWVLRCGYNFSADEICAALIKLFGLPNVHLSNPAWVAQAVEWHHEGLDFADAFHLVNSQSCQQLRTFDTRFVKRAKGKSECEVRRP